LASSDSNGQIKLWEVHSGKEIRTLVGHSKLVITLAFSPDGKLLASGGADKTLKLWQVSTGKMLRDLTVGVERLYTCAIRPAGQAFAFGGDDKIVRFWDLAEGEKIKTLRGHTDWVNDVVFSPDGNLLASASSDCTIKIFDAKKGQAVRTLKGHKASVNALAFSPDGKILASGSGFPNFSNFENDCSIKLWEVATGQCLRTLNKHTDQISRLVFHPAGRMLASCSDDRTIILWDIFAGNEKLLLKIHDDIVYDIVFHPQGDVLASSSWDKETGGMIKLWQLSTEKVIAHFEELEQPAATLAFSPDGKILAGGSVAGVKFWDMETRKEIPALTVETEEVRKLAFSPDGKRLLGACEDATARLWNLPGAQEIARLIITGPGDYVVATPDNYYYATKEAYKGLAFRLENKAYPFEQYDLKLNRPDIVLQRLGYASPTLMQVYHHAYLKRLKKMHFTEDMLGNDFHLPEITLTTPELPVSTTDKQLRFVIKANDSLYRLARLNVSVNDVPIYDANGFSLRNEQITTMEKEISLELSHGRNKIQVSALNEKGAESLKETFEIIYNGKEAQENLYVVAIGVSKYRSSQYNLTYAAKDADDLAALLESKKNKFGEVHVLRVLNENATRENILAARQFLMQSKVDDEVIVFAAGHGLLDDQLDYYFATTDIDFAHPAQRGLTYETIESLLDGIPARKKLLLMDTCHSGEVDKEETALVAEDRLETGMVKSRSFRNFKPAKAARHLSLSSSFELLRELFADLRRSSGAMVISAASGVEFAYEDHQWQNGAFTYCVLEGLKTGHADLNKDGEIHVSELRDYVSEKVQKLTNGKQTPTSRRENLEFDFKIF
jgi:WD40 repeat protein